MVSVSGVQVSCGVGWVWGLSEHQVKVSSVITIISKEKLFMRQLSCPPLAGSKESFFMRNFFILKIYI